MTMRTWTVRAALVSLVAGVVVAWPVAAGADTKQDCLAAYDKAQTLLQGNKLLAAREQLLMCGRAACPGFLADDCGKWLSETDTRTPTVVIEARGPDGQDAVEVTVEVDGTPWLSRIDGRALPIDPGEHVFLFRMNGAPSIERRLVVHEAVKGRRLLVQFESGKPDAGPPAAPAASLEAPPPKAGVPASVYLLGGIGLVGIASFAYFGLDYDSRLNDLDSCKPYCEASRTDRANVSRVLSFVSAGVGVAAIGTAAVLFFTSSGTSRPASNKVGAAPSPIDVLPVPGGALGVFRGNL